MSSRETKTVRPPPPPPPAAAGEDVASARTETLAAVLEREGRLSADSALALMQDVTSSLAEAHADGRLHGDIQPASVLITPDGRAELIGFPEAREAGDATGGEEPRAPLYYPPEVARAKRLDERSDLYLLGATFYHALAGCPPFEHANPEDSALLYIRQEAPPLGQVAPGTSVALCCVIHKLLRRKPDERYLSATEVLDALDQIESVIRKTRAVASRAAAAPARAPAPPARALAPPPPPEEPEEQEAGEEPEEPLSPAAERAALRRKQQTRLAIGLGVAFLGVLAIAAIIVMQGGRHEALPPPSVPAAPTQQALVPAAPAPKTVGPAGTVPTATTVPAIQKICLEAANAKRQGECSYESEPDKHCIGFWTGEDATVSWEFVVERPGGFAVEVVCAGDQAVNGNEFTVAVGQHRLRGTVRATGSWTNFEPQRVGIINLPLPSTYTLTVRPAKKPSGGGLMNLRSVNLIPVRR